MCNTTASPACDGFTPVPWVGCDVFDVVEPTRVGFAGCWHGRHEFVVDALEYAHSNGV